MSMAVTRHQSDDITTTTDPFNISARAYEIATLGIEDVPSMVALQDRTGTEGIIARTQDYYYSHLMMGNLAIGVRDSEGVLVGHALIKDYEGTSLIQNVLVDPAHRGQKLAGRLINSWLDIAQMQGVELAQARVRPENLASLKAFQACGLEITATYPSPENPHHMVHILTKDIKPGFIPA